MAHTLPEVNADRGHEYIDRTRLDPFNYLPGEITGLIIEVLDPPDTERLRRVCRSWKALSECFNGSQAIKRHCPKLYSPDLACVQIANLRFRRWLCTEQNIKVALAQTAVRSCKVTLWDICNHMLVTGNGSGRLMLRALQPCPTLPFNGSRQISLNSILRPFLKSNFRLSEVLATVDGDIVFTLETDEERYLFKMTTKGKIIWHLKDDWRYVLRGSLLPFP